VCGAADGRAIGDRISGLFPPAAGVFLSGLVFNRGSRILAATIGIGVGIYGSYAAPVGRDFVSVNGLFAVTSAGTAVVAEFLRAEMKRVMQADKTKAVLLQKIAHRTKNNLAVLRAMIRLQARNAEPQVAAPLEATARRLQVTAEVYDHLSLKEDSRLVDMHYFLTSVVEKIYQSLSPSGPIAFQVVCEDVVLPNQQALAIGIIANEFVTNSLKYCFPDDRQGHVAVELSMTKGIVFSVSDNGVGLRGEAEPSGLGSRIIMLLTQQLEGSLTYERLDAGLRVRLHAPAADVR
jgi:two-component sensor histidine kinase